MTSDGRTAVQCAGLPESDDTVTGNTAGASEPARACADGATDTAEASKAARDDTATAGASGTNGKTERCETATNSVANVQVNASNEGASTATGSAEAAIAADAPAPTSDDTDEVAIAEGAPGAARDDEMATAGALATTGRVEGDGTTTSAVADGQVSTDAASTAGAPATTRGDAGEVTTAAGMPRIANEANDDAATAGALTTGDNADEVEITANAEIVSSPSRYHEYFVRLDVEAGMAEDAPSLSPHKLTWLPAPFDTVQPADAGSPSAAAVSSGSAMNELADIELATTIAMHATLERPADTSQSSLARRLLPTWVKWVEPTTDEIHAWVASPTAASSADNANITSQARHFLRTRLLLAHWTALGLIDAVRLAATAAIRESSAASRSRRNTCLIAMDWLVDWWTHEVLRSSGPLIRQHALSLLLAAHDSPDNQARDDVHARDVAVLDALVQLQTSYIKPSSQEDSFMWLVNIAIYGAETEAELVANTRGTAVVTSAQIAQASLAAPRVIVKALSLPRTRYVLFCSN